MKLEDLRTTPRSTAELRELAENALMRIEEAFNDRIGADHDGLEFANDVVSKAQTASRTWFGTLDTHEISNDFWRRIGEWDAHERTPEDFREMFLLFARKAYAYAINARTIAGVHDIYGWYSYGEASYYLGQLRGHFWGAIEALRRVDDKQAKLSKLANDVNHQEARELRKMVCAFYDANRANYKSDAAIAKHISEKVVPLEIDTIKRHIRKHKKLNM